MTPQGTLTSDTSDRGFRLKGWHVFAGFATAFGIIIAVNVTLAVNAVRSFPGVETKNSYIASQTFDDRRAAQEALGWAVAATHEGDQLRLSIDDSAGQPVKVAALKVTLGRPTHVQDDRIPNFHWDGAGYVAQEPLAPGNWDLWIEAQAENGTVFEQRLQISMPF